MDKQALMNGIPINSLLGMPIYTLQDGRCLGSVKDVIFDPNANKLLAVTMEEPGFFAAHRYVLMFENIKSIGRDAITIDKSDVLKTSRNAPDIMRIVNRGHTMKGKTIVTESGNELGTISEALIDESTGQTVSYEVSRGMASDVGSGRNYVSAAHVIRMGRDALIVPDNVETTFAEQQPGGLAGAYQATRAKAADYGRAISQMTDQQRADMVRGKTAGNDVRDDQGLLIIAKGETVTDSTIELARQKGKLNDVAMSVASGMASAGYGRAKTMAGTSLQGAGAGWDEISAGMSRTWSNLTQSFHKSADQTGRRRAIEAQKKFLVGKISNSDVRDNRGNMLLQSGEVITPLVLDTLDRTGLLELVKVKPEEPVTMAKVEPQLRLVLEPQEQPRVERTRPHI